MMKDINLLPVDEKSKSSIKLPNISDIPLNKLIGIGVILSVLVASLVLPKIYIMILGSRLKSVETEIASPKFAVVFDVRAKISAEDEIDNALKTVINDVENKYRPVGESIYAIRQSLNDNVMIEAITLADMKMSIKTKATDVESGLRFKTNIGRIEYVFLENENEVTAYENQGQDISQVFNIDLVKEKEGESK